MNRMAATDEQLHVTSHVARDLLQSAGLFKTEKHVVWEYVSNGLQYTDDGVNPVVRVTLDTKKKRISIQDNGRGMDWSGLKNFFVMHGENLDRNQGKPGRGRFGTGKSAAFGIANTLRITTIRNQRRSIVQLKRSKIESMQSNSPIPVEIIEREANFDSPNGTLIEIEDILLKKLDIGSVIQYLQRHLARWPKNVCVFVNNHECEFDEPPVASEVRFKPEGELKKLLGDIELIVKTSKAYLEEELRGISIYSKGVWHETTLAGSEGKEMSQYIFGEIDVPQLEEDKSPISPFDVSRSMRLNLNNELVKAVYAFIGESVEKIRSELVQEEKRRKQDEETRRLSEYAKKIANVLNEDFTNYKEHLEKIKAKGGGTTDLGLDESGIGSEGKGLELGKQLPASLISETGGIGHGDGSRREGDDLPRNAPQVTESDDLGTKLGKPAGGPEGSRKTSGGFCVEFVYMGEDSHRAKYAPEQRTIFINLDHPQLVAARGQGSVDDPVFKKLAIEMAFSEYAIALASELDAKGNYLDPSDPIFDIRETLNRVARRGSELFSSVQIG